MGRKSKGIRLIYLKFYSKNDSVSLSLRVILSLGNEKNGEMGFKKEKLK